MQTTLTTGISVHDKWIASITTLVLLNSLFLFLIVFFIFTMEMAIFHISF